jgi:hypothetical protein
MSDLIALSSLLLRSRQRADMVNSDFVDDTTEVTQWVNEAIASMYDKLIESREDYYVSSTSFSTANGTDAYLIGSGEAINITDFYKLKGVDVVFGSNDRRSLRKFSFAARNRYNTSSAWTSSGYKAIRYRLRGLHLWFKPSPGGVYTVELWYYPRFTRLVNSADTFDFINGWDEYVVAKTARKMLMKEESDVSELNNEIAAKDDELKRAMSLRDFGEEEPPIDVNEAEYHGDDLAEEW